MKKKNVLAKKKKKIPGKSTRALLRHIKWEHNHQLNLFPSKEPYILELCSRRPDGKAWENSELFLLKPFPPAGPELKREALATDNWASVRGCGWHISKASVGL